MKRAKILFLDWRDIQCGHLEWLSPTGIHFGVANPPESRVPMHSESRYVPSGIRLQAEQSETVGPVDGWKGWGRTIHDGEKFRSWFFEVHGHTKLGSGAAAHKSGYEEVFVCGTVSEDGFAWTEDSRCRITLGLQRDFDGVTFFIDPVASEAERYKLIYCAHFPVGVHDDMIRDYLDLPPHKRDGRITWKRRYGLFCATSPDGREWKSCNTPFMLHPSDTDTTVLWDEALESYVMYTRLFRDDRRWIGRAESRDFVHWDPVYPVMWPRLTEPPDRDLYLNGYSRYPGLPEYQIMFPMIYHRATERSDVELASSSDGMAWQWVPSGPVIQPGRSGEWDCEFIGSGKDIVPFGPGKIATPYAGTTFPHKYPRSENVWDAWNLGWAIWSEDRLCGLVADEIGQFWTQPLLPAGPKLRLNCRVPLGGEIRIGIVGIDEKDAASCDPIVGCDGVVPVTWQGGRDLCVTDGTPVIIHVKLRKAVIFALEFCE